jgi:hypothetical protein
VSLPTVSLSHCLTDFLFQSNTSSLSHFFITSLSRFPTALFHWPLPLCVLLLSHYHCLIDILLFSTVPFLSPSSVSLALAHQLLTISSSPQAYRLNASLPTLPLHVSHFSFISAHCFSVTRPHCPTASLPHGLTVPLLQCHTASLSHCFSVTQPHCPTASVSHSLTVPQLRCHTASLSHCFSVTQPHCPTASVSHSLTVRLSHRFTFLLPPFPKVPLLHLCIASYNAYVAK